MDDERLPQALEEQIREMVEQEQDNYDQFTLELRIAGGIPEQAFNLDFRISGTGKVTTRLQDHLTEGYFEQETEEISHDLPRRLLERIIESDILRIPYENPLFVPDTLVGRLSIRYGELAYSILFPADEEQAKTNNLTISPQLQHLLTYVYELGKDITNVTIDPNVPNSKLD